MKLNWILALAGIALAVHFMKGAKAAQPAAAPSVGDQVGALPVASWLAMPQ